MNNMDYGNSQGGLGGNNENRYEENKKVIGNAIAKIVILSFGFEFFLFILSMTFPSIETTILSIFNRIDIHIGIIIFVLFFDGLRKLNLTFLEKYGGLSIVITFYMSVQYIINNGFNPKETTGIVYSFIYGFLGTNGILAFTLFSIVFAIVFIIMQWKDIMNFLSNSGILNNIKYLFGIKVKQEEVKEEVRKPQTIGEKLIDFTNKQLENFEYRKTLDGGRAVGANAIDFFQGINGFLVTVDPGGKSFDDLIDFCSSTLGEKSRRFETGAHEIIKDGKRMLLVSYAKPPNFKDPDFVKNKIKHFSKFKELNFFKAIKAPKIEPQFNKSPTMMYFGVDQMGKPLLTDMVDAPHVLITGQTMGGKSVLMHNLINSMMHKLSPEELQIALIDPKDGVEFGFYAPSPYFQKYPLAASAIEGMGAFGLVFKEYKRRTEILKRHGARKVTEIPKEKWAEEGLHFIVVMVDEYAELRTDPKNGNAINGLLERFSQLMRFAGIHLIIATQKVDSNTLSSKFKANLPLKISLKLDNWRDYMQTFGVSPGKVRLQGLGDALMLKGGELIRFQGAAISSKELSDLVLRQKEDNPQFEYHDEESKKKQRIKGLVFLKEMAESKDELELAAEEEMNGGEETANIGDGLDGFEEKDFDVISDEIYGAIERIEEMNLGGYVDKNNTKLRYMDSSALKMLSYMFKEGQLDRGILKIFPTVASKELSKFRNYLIHAGVVTVEGADEDNDKLYDAKNPLIPIDTCPDPFSMFILLGKYAEKDLGRNLNN